MIINYILSQKPVGEQMHHRWLIIVLISVPLHLSFADSLKPCLSAGDIFIKECCQSALSECLSRKAPCPIAFHLESFRMWLHSRDLTCEEINDAVVKRYHLFLDTSCHAIDRNGFEVAGELDAPLEIVVYISMNCPLCKRLYDELLDSLEVLSIGNYVNVVAKPFTTGEIDRLYAATAFWKKQSFFLRAIRPVKERITPEIVRRITDSLGIPGNELVKRSASPEVRTLVKKAREEGVHNGVSVTPTFFVNGVRYTGYKDIRWILDYLKFLHDSKK